MQYIKKMKNMSAQRLPIEIIEQIINEGYSGSLSIPYSGGYLPALKTLQNYALVCRQWAMIANNILWKKVTISPNY